MLCQPPLLSRMGGVFMLWGLVEFSKCPELTSSTVTRELCLILPESQQKILFPSPRFEKICSLHSIHSKEKIDAWAIPSQPFLVLLCVCIFRKWRGYRIYSLISLSFMLAFQYILNIRTTLPATTKLEVTGKN